MANFTTHIAVGTMASGMLATLTMAANVVEPHDILTLALAGTLGSVLPDIDLKDSRPSQAIFSGLGIFIAFAVLFNVSWKYSIAEMWILWLGVFLFVRYGAQWFFHHYSYHRGIYHSLLAAVFFGLLTAAVYRHVFGAHEAVAWLAGVFMLAGYLVHLTLDEIYSVDVMDVRIKASFGTALKPIDHNHLGHSALMAAAVVAVFAITPPFGTFWQHFSSQEIWAGLHQRLLPQDKWFGFIADVHKHKTGGTITPTGGAHEIRTGTIPASASGSLPDVNEKVAPSAPPPSLAPAAPAVVAPSEASAGSGASGPGAASEDKKSGEPRP